MGKYKSYKNSSNKLNKLFNTESEGYITLAESEFALKKLFLEKGIEKTSAILYDSNWIAEQVNYTSPLLKSTKKGDLLPGKISFNYPINLNNFPNKFLPYLKVQTFYKTIPENEVVGAFVANPKSWSADYYEVTTGSTILYKGIRFNAYKVFTIPEYTALRALNIPDSHFKKVWRCTFEYSKSGIHYRIQGNIRQLTLDKTVNICETNKTSVDSYFCNNGGSFVDITATDKITSVTKNDIFGINVVINLKATLTQKYYTNTNQVDTFSSGIAQDNFSLTQNPRNGLSGINSVKVNGNTVGYTFNSPNTIILNTPATFGDSVVIDYQYCLFSSTPQGTQNPILNFNSLNSFILRWDSVATKFILSTPGGSVISSTGFGGGIIDTSTVDTINDIKFDLLGYYLYYDSNTKYGLGINTSGVLTNIPDPAQVSFTAIQLKRNPSPYPKETIGANTLIDFFSNTEDAWLLVKDYKNELGKYYLQHNIEAIILTKANVLAQTITFNIFDDIYSASGLTFVPVNNHNTIDKKLYKAENTDILYKVQVIFFNPFIDFSQVKQNG